MAFFWLAVAFGASPLVARGQASPRGKDFPSLIETPKQAVALLEDPSFSERCAGVLSRAGESYQCERPDLLRALLPVMLRDPALRNKWESTTETNNPFRQLLWKALELAPQGVSTRTLLREAIRAERRKDPDTLAWWISVLGRRDSTLGDKDLLRWSLFAGQSSADRRVADEALKALFRRLVGDHRVHLEKRLKNMPPEARADLVWRILASTYRFPKFRSGLLLTDDVSQLCPRQVTRPEERSFQLRANVAFLYQDALLEWIAWTRHPDDLYATYAMMTAPEARRRFLNILGRGNPGAIRQVWLCGLDVPNPMLEQLRKNAPDPAALTFLELTLAERGDDSAYLDLKQRFLRAIGSDYSFDTLIETVATEMERRQDWQGLTEALAALRPPKIRDLTTVTDEKWKSFYRIMNRANVGCWCTRAALLLGALARAQFNLAVPMLDRLDPQQDKDRLLLLQAAVSAKRPEMEPYLRECRPSIDVLRANQARWREATERGFWLSGLEATATPWCRDELLREGGMWELAEVGDPRALGPAHPNSPGRVAYAAWILGDAPAILTDLRRMRPPASLRELSYEGYYPFPMPIAMHYPPGRLEKTMNELVAVFPSLSREDKLRLLWYLQPSPKFWTRDLGLTCLRDKEDWVRLKALLHILQHPDPSLNDRVREIEASDPYRWNRVIAKEIIDFRPDPLEPGRGERFVF